MKFTLIFSLFLSFFLSSCGLLDYFSLDNLQEAETLASENTCQREPKPLRYYSDNDELDNQFTQYQQTQSKQLQTFSKEAISYSLLHGAASPHIISESANISTIIKYKGKVYFNVFNDSLVPNFSNYIWYLTSTLQESDPTDFIANFNQTFSKNLSVSKNFENFIEKNKSKLIKDEKYGKNYFRGIAPLKEGETFTRNQFIFQKIPKASFGLSPLSVFKNSYLCNFQQDTDSPGHTDISQEIGSETFGLFKDENNFFITTISSIPAMENSLAKKNLGTNAKTPISTALCLNDKFIIVSKDEYFAKEILLENFLKNRDAKNSDPTLFYASKRHLKLDFPPRLISEIYGEEKVARKTNMKKLWLKTLGNIEVLNILEAKVYYDPRKGYQKCN